MPTNKASSPGDFPDVIGRYRLESILGTGGMGIVYRAYDETLQRHVALKVILGENIESAPRFLQEARAQAKVEHEHICKIYEVGEAEGKHFIAMQLIEGKLLDEISKEMTLEQKVKTLKMVAEAVHEAHKRGLIHRDIKPSNIMVDQTGAGEWKPYIMDFGLAREVGGKGLTVSGIVVGTPAYMAPEQADGDNSKLDRRTDVYGLGATMYELLTGQLPFDGESSVTILFKLLQEEPRSLRAIEPSIPRDLDAIALKSLEKEPQHRYESARALAEDLGNWLAGETVLAARTDLPRWLLKKARKHRWAFALSAIVAILIAVSTILMVRERHWATEQVRLANDFGKEVERIDAFVARVYLLPRHNVEYVRVEVERKMKEIQRQMDQLGEVAQGPGNYALGRGYMALGDYRKAKEKLELSWKEDKYRSVDLAYALGLTLVEIYRSEMEDASHIPFQGQREARMRELDKLYRAPALECIGKSKIEKGIESAYVSALVKFLDRDYAGVTKQLEPIVPKTEELYQIELLMGDAYRMLGNQSRDQGQVANAGAFYDRSQKMYEQAIRKGESDPRTYEHLCGLQSDIIWMHAFLLGEPPSGGYEKTLSACDQAIEVDRQSPDAWTQKVLTMNWWGEYQVKRGMDPRPVIAQAIQGGLMLTKTQPDREVVYTVLGGAYWVQSQYEEDHGIDPRDSLKKCEDAFHKAVSVNANDAFSWTMLGGTYAVQSEYEIQQSLDPAPSLSKAMEGLEKSRRIDPDFIFTLINLGYANILQARHELSLGLDPQASLERALQNLKDAWRVNPGNILTQYLQATASLYRGNYELMQGGDPGATLQKAKEDFESVLRNDPHYSSSNMRLGVVEYLQALYEASHARNPQAALDRAHESLQKAVEENPEHAESLFWEGKTYLLNAQWALQQRRSPESDLTRAEDWLNRAAEKNLRMADALTALAVFHRMKADLQTRQNNPSAVERELSAGIQTVDKALALNPRLLSARVERAALLLLHSRYSHMAADQGDRQSALTFLAEAIHTTPFLQHEYGSFLKANHTEPQK